MSSRASLAHAGAGKTASIGRAPSPAPIIVLERTTASRTNASDPVSRVGHETSPAVWIELSHGCH